MASPLLWNLIPCDVLSKPAASTFKHKLKRFLFVFRLFAVVKLIFCLFCDCLFCLHLLEGRSACGKLAYNGYDYAVKGTAWPDQHIVVQNLDKTKSRVKKIIIY